MTNEWAPFLHLFKQLEIPSKTILLREGEIAKTMFFISYEEASHKLNKHGISIVGSNSLEDLWKKNEADPEEVLAWILK